MGSEVIRPKPTTAKKVTPQESGEKVQRLLLTWISDYPRVYGQVKQYISPQDFTKELYRKVAEIMFRELENGTLNPAAMRARIAARPSSLWLVAESTLMPPCRRKPGLCCSTEICRGWGMMAGSISPGAEGRALAGENSIAAAVASPHRRR